MDLFQLVFTLSNRFLKSKNNNEAGRLGIMLYILYIPRTRAEPGVGRNGLRYWPWVQNLKGVPGSQLFKITF